MTTSYRPFQEKSELKDGVHYFKSNLYIAGKVVQIASSITIVEGKVDYCECIACETQSFKRDDENDIRKAIVFLLNESAANSVILTCGIQVFTPLVFNFGLV